MEHRIHQLDEESIKFIVEHYYPRVIELVRKSSKFEFAQDVVQDVFLAIIAPETLDKDWIKTKTKYEDIIAEIVFHSKNRDISCCKDIAKKIIQRTPSFLKYLQEDKDGIILQNKKLITQDFQNEYYNEEDNEYYIEEEDEEHDDSTHEYSQPFSELLQEYKDYVYQELQDLEKSNLFWSEFLEFIHRQISAGVKEALRKMSINESQYMHFIKNLEHNHKAMLAQVVFNTIRTKIEKFINKNNIKYGDFVEIFLKRHSIPTGIALDSYLRTNIKSATRKIIYIDTIIKNSKERLQTSHLSKIASIKILNKKHSIIQYVDGQECIINKNVEDIYDIVSKATQIEQRNIVSIACTENEVYVITKSPASLLSQRINKLYAEKLDKKYLYLKNVIAELLLS